MLKSRPTGGTTQSSKTQSPLKQTKRKSNIMISSDEDDSNNEQTTKRSKIQRLSESEGTRAVTAKTGQPDNKNNCHPATQAAISVVQNKTFKKKQPLPQAAVSEDDSDADGSPRGKTDREEGGQTKKHKQQLQKQKPVRDSGSEDFDFDDDELDAICNEVRLFFTKTKRYKKCLLRRPK